MSGAFSYFPKGFFSSCEVVNELPKSLIQDMVSAVSPTSASPSTTVNFYKIYLSMVPPSPELFTAGQISGALNALQFIGGQLVSNKITTRDDMISSLSTHTSLLPTVLELVVDGLIALLDSNNQRNTSSSFSLGKIVSCQWKLGMGVSSSNCVNLRAPFVTLMFRIDDGNGVRNQPMELTIPQFQQLRSTLQELVVAMDDI